MIEIDNDRLADILEGLYLAIVDIRTVVMEKHDVYITIELSELCKLVNELSGYDRL